MDGRMEEHEILTTQIAFSCHGCIQPPLVCSIANNILRVEVRLWNENQMNFHNCTEEYDLLLLI